MRGWIRRGPRYSTMKTVRHEIWGPENYVRCDMSIQSEERTQVLYVDGTLVPDTRVMNGYVRSIGNCRAIAAFCDLQTMDVELGGFGNLFVDICCGSIRAHIDRLWEVPDRAA
jgi:hypothetical protein